MAVEKIKEHGKNVTDKIIRVSKGAQKIKLVDEFKDFISKGNVLDLAVGVIIGGAFQNIVASLTNNLINPLLGCFSEVDFNEYTLKIGTLNLKYGAFLTDVINFIIMAFIVFLIVKVVNKFLKKQEAKEGVAVEVKKPNSELLLEEIRDLLKEKQK